jgi:hypothetical protein
MLGTVWPIGKLLDRRWACSVRCASANVLETVWPMYEIIRQAGGPAVFVAHWPIH